MKRLLGFGIGVWLLFCGHALALPSLDPVAQALADLDTRQAEVLDSHYQSYYQQAPLAWQLRWHLLRCEAADLANDTAQVQRQVDEGLLLAVGSPYPVVGEYLKACEANTLKSQERALPAIELLSEVVNNAEQHQDEHLLRLALTRRAQAYSDSGEHGLAMDDIRKALKPSVHHSQWFSFPDALIQFSAARTYFYLNNFNKSEQAFRDALSQPSLSRSLAWFIRINFAGILAKQGRTADALAQMARTGTPPEHLGPIDQAHFELFYAELLLSASEYRKAKKMSLKSQSAFQSAQIPDQAIASLWVAARSQIELNEEEGWESLEVVRSYFRNKYEHLQSLADTWNWQGQYNKRQGQFQQAINAMEEYQGLLAEQVRQQQGSALAQQQLALEKELEHHRQRLAQSGQTRYAMSKTLLIWQSLTGLLILLILVLALLVVRRNRFEVLPTRANWRTELEQALLAARQAQQRLPLLQVHSQSWPLQELDDTISLDLRPGDLCLPRSTHKRILVLHGAGDDELVWRSQRLTERLNQQSPVAVTVTWLRALDFDNLDSLLGKLDYQSISQRLAQDNNNSTTTGAVPTCDLN